MEYFLVFENDENYKENNDYFGDYYENSEISEDEFNKMNDLINKYDEIQGNVRS